MKIIKYIQKWDYHQQHHIQIMERGKYVGGGYISEESNDITITGVYVLKKHRYKGYGSIIITELMNQVEKLGFNEVWLMVKKENKNLIKMYESKSFVVEKDVGNGVYQWMRWEKKFTTLDD